MTSVTWSSELSSNKCIHEIYCILDMKIYSFLFMKCFISFLVNRRKVVLSHALYNFSIRDMQHLQSRYLQLYMLFKAVNLSYTHKNVSFFNLGGGVLFYPLGTIIYSLWHPLGNWSFPKTAKVTSHLKNLPSS